MQKGCKEKFKRFQINVFNHPKKSVHSFLFRSLRFVKALCFGGGGNDFGFSLHLCVFRKQRRLRASLTVGMSNSRCANRTASPKMFYTSRFLLEIKFAN